MISWIELAVLLLALLDSLMGLTEATDPLQDPLLQLGTGTPLFGSCDPFFPCPSGLGVSTSGDSPLKTDSEYCGTLVDTPSCSLYEHSLHSMLLNSPFEYAICFLQGF